jgi:hypothetical protein
MQVSKGDRLIMESERVGQPPRIGTVEEVLSVEPLRLQVRWETGAVSTVAPDAGAARIEHAVPRARQAARR